MLIFSGWRRVHQTDLGSRHLLCQREDRALPPGVLQFARMELLWMCQLLLLYVACMGQMCQMLFIQNFVTWRFDGKFSNHQPQLIGLWLGCNNCNGIPTKMSSNISLIVIVLTNDIVGYCYWVERYSLITTATSGSVHQPNLMTFLVFPNRGRPLPWFGNCLTFFH